MAKIKGETENWTFVFELIQKGEAFTKLQFGPKLEFCKNILK